MRSLIGIFHYPQSFSTKLTVAPKSGNRLPMSGRWRLFHQKATHVFRYRMTKAYTPCATSLSGFSAKWKICERWQHATKS